jgi:hypothetical protein
MESVYCFDYISQYKILLKVVQKAHEWRTDEARVEAIEVCLNLICPTKTSKDEGNHLP